MTIDWEIDRQYKIHLDDGDVTGAIRFLSNQLRALPPGPFHVALECEITDEQEELAGWLRSCLAAAGEVQPVGAIYLGLNGFDINTDLWFCGVSAYPVDPDADYFESLGENWFWASEDYFAIEGLQPLQRVFAEHRQSIRSDAGMYAGLLVLLKFCAFVKSATALLSPRDFTVIAGAKDYEDKLVIP